MVVHHVRRPWRGRLAAVLAGLAVRGTGGEPAAAGATAVAMPPRDLQSDTWVATDALGRTLPGAVECGPPREGAVVGIFYFLWLGAHSRRIHDISKILAGAPPQPAWGPEHAFHFWGEPYLGYYRSEDEFVIRRHAQMLTDAGVDVLFFDVTNAVTYDDNVLAVCRVLADIRRGGRTTPQIAFLTNSRSGKVVQTLYDQFYGPGLHQDLWFRWQGRPLILAKPDEMTEAQRQFFTVRQSWAWTDPRGWFGDGRDKWPWVDHYPQKPGWHESPEKPEELAVAVAQHPTSNIGRSFHDGRQPPPPERRPELGLCFAEQWRRALDVKPQLLFVTGWNEWVAQRFIKKDKGGPGTIAGVPLKPGDSYFVDQFSQEYSRDIEPMRGGHGDNYYYQMVDGIRRFKGVRPRPRASAPRSIRIDQDFSQWLAVGPEFLDDLGDTAHRDHPAWEPLPPYVNTTGRNDVEAMKVARDSTHLFFYVQTREPITAPEGKAWMLLLLDVDGNPRNGWYGYDILVNRCRRTAGTCTVERHAGGWEWEPVADVPCAWAGRELHLAVPRSLLGLASDRGPLRLDLKWADNIPDPGDILSFIDQGDVAPNGRFNYRYEE